MLVYFDTSAVLPWFISDVHTRAIQEWAAGTAPRVVLSDFAAAEFAAAVCRAVRVGRFRARAAHLVFGRFDLWRLHTEQRRTGGDEFAACERLVRDRGLKLNAPDALHLAIAKAEGVPLVTFDRRLAAATQATGHPVIVPGE